MHATKRGFAHYLVVCAVWSLPGRQHTQDEMAAWRKKRRTIRASLYAETAIRKMPIPTIDWDEQSSNSGTMWI
jgi:hypothetical protein